MSTRPILCLWLSLSGVMLQMDDMEVLKYIENLHVKPDDCQYSSCGDACSKLMRQLNITVSSADEFVVFPLHCMLIVVIC